MNLAQLLGELESAVDEAKEAGERVRKAIEGLKSIFGSIGITGQSVTVIEPTMDLPEETKIACPYCGKLFPAYHHKRGHRRDSQGLRVIRHIASFRRKESRMNPPVETHGKPGTRTGFHR